MNAACIMAWKDLRLLLRDRAALFWIFAFPALFALFLASIMQAWSNREEVGLDIAIVDRDRSPAARAYLSRLSEHASLIIRELDLGAARALLRRGEIDALVIVHPAFARTPDWYTGSTEVLEVESAPNHPREARYVQGVLIEAGLAEAVENELTSDPRASVRMTVSPALAIAPTPYELVTPMAVLWGLIGCAAAFSVSIAAERQNGMLRRLRALPIGAAHVLLGKALACWLACLTVATVILACAVLGAGVRLTHPWALMGAVAVLALCFAGLMAAISTFGASERSVAGAGWATLLFLAMIGGVMAPRMIMPDWLKSCGRFSPVHWGVVALESALWRGPDAEALLASLALGATGLIGLCIGALVLARSAA